MMKTISIHADMKTVAMLAAMAVRIELEDLHVKRRIPDSVMREINPILRNGIFTALHAARSMSRSEGARAWALYRLDMVPKYWEQPELLPEYVKNYERRGETIEES